MKKDLQERIESLAKLLFKSRYPVFFAGAGISTESGLPDFRGPDGMWTRRDKGLAPKPSRPWDSVKPNNGHMAPAELEKMGKLKFLISQNVDNLHLNRGKLHFQFGESSFKRGMYEYHQSRYGQNYLSENRLFPKGMNKKGSLFFGSTLFQVCTRYVFSNLVTWSEELSRFALPWLTFLAAAVAFKGGESQGRNSCPSHRPGEWEAGSLPDR